MLKTILFCILSSVGRVPDLHSGCRRFEPVRMHHSEVYYRVFLIGLVTLSSTLDAGKRMNAKPKAGHSSADHSSVSMLRYGENSSLHKIEIVILFFL